MNAAVERVLDALRASRCDPRPNGKGWKFNCPCDAHGPGGDKTPSGKLDIGQDGRVLIHCFAGGTFENILSRIGLGAGACFPNKSITVQRRSPKERKPAGLQLAEGIVLGSEPHTTDLGNAELFAAENAERLRYVHDLAAWYVWTDTHWHRDDTGEVLRLARETVAWMYARGAFKEDLIERQGRIKHALASESQKRLGAMVDLARHDARLAITSTTLDADPWLLNVENGTLDLRAGQLRPHRLGDFITYCLPIAYDPASKAPAWQCFLERVLVASVHRRVDDEESIELRRFVQRGLGYSLTGDVSEHVLFFVVGDGANGKSTFLEVVSAILGPLARVVPFETLMHKRGGDTSVPNDIARMRGVRFATAIEAEEGRRFAEAKLKSLTGGDRIVAREMRSAWFEFQPTFKLWIAANHKPRVLGTNEATWRRIRLVPFDVTIPDGERDPQLKSKLLAEAPGILAWMVEGCLEWRKHRLGTAAAVMLATSEYRGEEDVVGNFIRELCVVHPSASVRTSDLHHAYTAWAESNGEPMLSSADLGLRIRGRTGIERYRTNAVRGWRGIGLAADGCDK